MSKVIRFDAAAGRTHPWSPTELPMPRHWGPLSTEKSQEEMTTQLWSDETNFVPAGAGVSIGHVSKDEPVTITKVESTGSAFWYGAWIQIEYNNLSELDYIIKYIAEIPSGNQPNRLAIIDKKDNYWGEFSKAIAIESSDFTQGSMNIKEEIESSPYSDHYKTINKLYIAIVRNAGSESNANDATSVWEFSLEVPTVLIGRYDTALYGRNDCAFKIVATGAFTVTWSDGVTESYSTTTIISRILPDGVYSVTVEGAITGYRANFRDGADNLYAPGLHEQHYYGKGWDSTYHQYSDVKYYFEHDEIGMDTSYRQFSHCKDIFIDKSFHSVIIASETFSYGGTIVLPSASFSSATHGNYFAYHCSRVYAPLITFSSLPSATSIFENVTTLFAPSLSLPFIGDAQRSFRDIMNIVVKDFKFPSLTDGNLMFYNSINITHAQCVEVLNSLPDRTSMDPSPKIDLRYTAGASLVTDAEKLPAEDNGWVVVLA